MHNFADFVAFGLAPACLILGADAGDVLDPGLGHAPALIFVFGCCLRLARYNVQDAAADPETFRGLSSTLAGALVAAAVLSALAHDLTLNSLPWLLALLGILMLSTPLRPLKIHVLLARTVARGKLWSVFAVGNLVAVYAVVLTRVLPEYLLGVTLIYALSGAVPRPRRVGGGVLVEADSAAHWLGMDDDQLSRELTHRVPLLKGMSLHRQGAHVYTLGCAHVSRYRASGAVLIGDAAHCTNPTAGQGMAMALTDAGALAEQIGPMLAQGGDDLESALAAFETRQWSLNQRLVRASHRLARLYALRGATWHGLKTTAIRLLAHPYALGLISPIIASFLKQPADTRI